MSGLPQDNDDPLSRRDMGLEFLDVTNRVSIAAVGGGGQADEHGGEEQRVVRITNTGTRPVDTHLLVIASGLSFQIEMTSFTLQLLSGQGNP